MDWKRLLWPLGGALIALLGIKFVFDALTETQTHSWQEKTFLIVSLSLGALAVAVYWIKKWFNLRDALERGETLLSRIPRRYFFLLLFFVIFIIYMQWEADSAPEFVDSQKFIQSNQSVLSRFGALKKVDKDNWKISFHISNGIRSGTYQFHVEGALRKGLVRVVWHDEDGKFVPTEIDEITKSDESIILWPSKP